MRWLVNGLCVAAVALCGAVWASGATGDVLGVEVLATGWEAEITLEGLSPYTTAYVGYGDPNMMTPPTAVALAVTSPGYTTAAAATTVTRTVYATRTQRKLTPNEANLWEVTSGSDLVIRVALSDYIYSADTVTATIVAGWATTAGGANTAYSGAVTNSSTLAYPPVHCQWAWPDLERWGAAELAAGYDLECVAVSHWASERKLTQCVKYTLTGMSSSATLSATVTTPTLSSRTYPYAQTVPQCTVYKYTVTAAALVTAGFTDNEIVKVSVSAYPRIGQAAAVATSDPSGDPNTTLFCDQRFVYDPDDDYGAAYARVSPTGNDGTGAVAATAAGATNAYATIQAAAVAIKSFNNAQYSRNEPGNGVVLVDAGTYPWTGLTSAPGDMGAQNVWLTVRGDVTDPNTVQITTATTNKYLDARRLKLQNLKIAPSTPGTTLVWGRASTSAQWIWLDQVQIDQGGNGTPPAPYLYTNVFATRCYYPNGVYLTYYSTTNTGVRLARNCYLDHGSTSSSGNVMPYACLANACWKVLLTPPADTNGSPHADGSVTAWNAFYKTQATLISGGTIPTATRAWVKGWSFVGNIVEKCTTTNPAIEIAANFQAVDCNYVRLLFNTFVGERENLAYSWDTGGALRTGWTMVGNVCKDWNTKHDVFTSDATDIGGKSQEYGVACRFNRNIGATFPAQYSGLYQGDGTAVASWTNDQSYPTTTGGGDYMPTALSELMGAIEPGGAVMPYDLWGTPLRDDGTDAAGAVQRTSATTCYVATTGTDSTAGGRGLSAGLPWLTPSYAYDQAPSGTTIHVAAGTYSASPGISIDGNKSLTFDGVDWTTAPTSLIGTTGRGVEVPAGNYSGTVTLRDLGLTASTANAAIYSNGSTSQVSLRLERCWLTLPASYSASYAIQITAGTAWYRTFSWEGGGLTCGSPYAAPLIYPKVAALTVRDVALPTTTDTCRNLMTQASPISTMIIERVTGKTGQLTLNPGGGSATDFIYAAGNVIESGVWGSGTDPNQGGFFLWSNTGILDAPRLAVFIDNTLTGRNDMIYVADPNAQGVGGGQAIAIGNTIHGTGDGTTSAHGIGPGTGMESFYRFGNAVYLSGANTYGMPAKSKNSTLLNNVVEAYVPLTLAGGYDRAGNTDPNNYQSGAVVAGNTCRVNATNGIAMQLDQYNGSMSGTGSVKSWPVKWRIYGNVFDAHGVSGAVALKVSTTDTAPDDYWAGWCDNNTYAAGGTYVATIGGVNCTTLADMQIAWDAAGGGAGRDGNDDHSTLVASFDFPATATGAQLKTVGAPQPATSGGGSSFQEFP